MRARAALLALAVGVLPAAAAHSSPPNGRHKLLVLSVDGLDWRYIRDADKMGLKIPNVRKLLKRSQYADGVIGVWPTITWPSHTAIITGARPDQSGILSNARGTLDPALSYWSASKLKVQTLWQCAGAQGLTTATITWPVTMDGKITWNLPETFLRRNGGSMDLEAVEKYATPGLVAEIAHYYPSFRQQWVDDRTRVQATLFLLRHKQPDLILTHLVDLDSEEHDQGPYTVNADAIMERTDELIGDIVKALPKNYDFALVSDHGFERIDHISNIRQQAPADIAAALQPMGGIVVAGTAAAASWLREQAIRPDSDVGREIPHDELVRYAPKLADAVAAFEPAPHTQFGRSQRDVPREPPPEKGDHGFWPLRPDYRSTFALSGPGVKPGNLGPVEMLSLKDRLAAPLGVNCAKPE